MKVEQLRRVLARFVHLHRKGGQSAEADALEKLSRAISAADKEQVAKVVEKVRSQ